MSKNLLGIASCMSALILTTGFPAKTRAQEAEGPRAVDLGIIYIAERAKIASVPCGCFWLQGGGADVAVTISRGFGAAASISGQHRSNVTPGVDLNKFSLMAGPRYTQGISRLTSRYLGEKRSTSVFGEALFGYVHGFNSLFPTSAGVQSSANAFSMQIGGGMNVNLARGIGLRALDIGYIRTKLPNGTSNTQNDFRLGVGVTYHIRIR